MKFKKNTTFVDHNYFLEKLNFFIFGKPFFSILNIKKKDNKKIVATFEGDVPAPCISLTRTDLKSESKLFKFAQYFSIDIY